MNKELCCFIFNLNVCVWIPGGVLTCRVVSVLRGRSVAGKPNKCLSDWLEVETGGAVAQSSRDCLT